MRHKLYSLVGLISLVCVVLLVPKGAAFAQEGECSSSQGNTSSYRFCKSDLEWETRKTAQRLGTGYECRETVRNSGQSRHFECGLSAESLIG